MKLISYSLFGYDKITDENKFEFRAYLRGFYFNCRMNNLIYPDWKTHLEVDKPTYTAFQGLFDWLVNNNNLSLNICEGGDPLCKAMLWRMKPIFYPNVTHVICRDTDSVTTYREAKCVQRWLELGLGFHGITDNPAHGIPMMGGMVGFVSSKVKAIFGWQTWDEMLKSTTIDFSNRGSDQIFMTLNIYPNVKNLEFCAHFIQGQKPRGEAVVEQTIPELNLPQVNKKLWESDLVCRHIGSAGVVEMEILRFFRRFDEYNWKYKEIEQVYPEIFYWQIP